MSQEEEHALFSTSMEKLLDLPIHHRRDGEFGSGGICNHGDAHAITGEPLPDRHQWTKKTGQMPPVGQKPGENQKGKPHP